MNKKAMPVGRQGFATIIAIIIAILVIGGVVYVVQTKKVSAPQTAPSPTPVSETVPVDGSAGLTASWKTYRNEKYGFEFDYPALWRAQVEAASNPVVGRLVVSLIASPSYLISFSRVATDYKSMTEVIAGLNANCPQSVAESIGCPHITVKEPQVVINGLPAIRTTYSGEGGTYDAVQIFHNKTLYAFSQAGVLTPSMIDQIAKTFRILNPTSKVPANWKTYEGEGITFRYPSDWNVEKIYYATAAQEAEGIPPSVSAYRMFPGTKITGKDFIDIGGHQVDCTLPHTKCVAIYSIGTFVITNSADPTVLAAFDGIASTIQFLNQ